MSAENPGIDYHIARELFQAISISKCQDRWRDLLAKAATYARIRVDWILADKAKQSAMGEQRTAHHNAFIAACDELAEVMTDAGEETAWRERLGEDRKIIGDFACFVHCILGQIAR
jgi:hypothetical protein